MYRLLRKWLCQQPDTCGGNCRCTSIGDTLTNHDALWSRRQRAVRYRDITVPHTLASYRNEHTQENCVITIENHHAPTNDDDEDDDDETPEKTYAAMILDTRNHHLPKNAGSASASDNHAVPMRDLLPIAQPLTLTGTIHKDFWDMRNEISQVLPLLLQLVKGYEPWVPSTTIEEHYERYVCNSGDDEVDPAAYGLPLFYKKTNPLGIVLQLLGMDPNPVKNPEYIIMEYIFSVCMMFYTMCNGRWMVKSTDPNVPFSERNSEYIVVLFPSYDFVDKSNAPIDSCYEAVKEGGLSRFVSSVLHHLHNNNELFRKHVDAALITKFLSSKLVGNNFMQTIETLHWVVHPVEELNDNVVASKRAAGEIPPRVSAVKWEGATGFKSCNLEVYKSETSIPRIPSFFSHSFFNPHTPCIRLPEEVANAWQEQAEAAIDVMVVGLAWLKTRGEEPGTQLQEPPSKRPRNNVTAIDQHTVKTEKAKTLVNDYYDNYTEKVSATARHAPQPPDAPNEERIDAVLNRVRQVIIQLSMCCQQKCATTFTTAVQHRFATLPFMKGIVYGKTVNWYSEYPQMWPKIPRYRHPQTLYIDNGKQYVYTRLYMPQLCQPGWQQQCEPWASTLPHDWYAPVTGVMGMSPSGFKWCIKKGWGTNLVARANEGRTRYNRCEYTLVEQLMIQRYLQDRKACNAYVAWCAWELLLGDEALTAWAMWRAEYGEGIALDDDRVHKLLQRITEGYRDYIVHDVMNCEMTPVVRKFFRKLFDRYCYNEDVFPTREELKLLMTERDLEDIVKEEFKTDETGAEIMAIKNGESILPDEAYQMICEGINPADAVGAQNDSYVECGDKRINLNAFYNWLHVKAFMRYVYKPLSIWYTCMQADGITMSDNRGWTSHLVTLDIYSVLLERNKRITDMYMNKQVQSLLKKLVQHKEPLPASLQLQLRIASVVFQSNVDAAKNLPNDVKHALVVHSDNTRKRKMLIKQQLLTNPLAELNIVRVWQALENLGCYSTDDIAHKVAKWLYTTRTRNMQALQEFVRRSWTDGRIKAVAAKLHGIGAML